MIFHSIRINRMIRTLVPVSSLLSSDFKKKDMLHFFQQTEMLATAGVC